MYEYYLRLLFYRKVKWPRIAERAYTPVFIIVVCLMAADNTQKVHSFGIIITPVRDVLTHHM